MTTSTPFAVEPNANDGNRGRVAPVIALAVILLGAFFLASTPARNSDLWLRLATGRGIVDGSASFGKDPFAYTTEGVRWVNHSWLSSVVLYLAYTKLGASSLVVLKAVFFALTFGVVFLSTRGKGSWVAAAALAGVAALASGVVTSVRPVVVSYFFFAITLAVLFRETDRNLWKARWPLLAMFALWANLDDWFFVGPVAVLLFAFGRVLGRGWGESRVWVAFAAASFAVCLLNPHFHRVFQLPPELALTGVPEPLRVESTIRALDVPAYSHGFVFPPRLFVNPSAVAFAVILLVSLGSLALPSRAARAQRVLLFIAFAALGVLHARAIPFAAVATAIIAGLPLRELQARAGQRGLVMVACSFAAIAFLGASWAGWMQNPPYGARAWNVEPDPSLRDTAEKVAKMRADGLIPADSRVFTFSAEAAHYFAWYAPSERVFLDSRWPLFANVANDYAAVRKWLTARDDSGRTEAETVFRNHRVSVIVAHDPDSAVMDACVGNLASNPKLWVLLNVSGRAAIFGWNGSDRNFENSVLNLDQLAFSPTHARLSPATGTAIPAPKWTDNFLRPAIPLNSLNRDQADIYATLFDGIRSSRRATPATVGTYAVTSFVGFASGAGPGRSLASFAFAYPGLRIQKEDRALGEYGYWMRDAVLRGSNEGPMAPLILAIRSARHAVAEHPLDARAHLILGDAYLRLSQATRETIWGREILELPEVRKVQAVNAYAQAARLDPDLLPARVALYQLFRQSNSLDLALTEIDAVLRITRRLDQRNPSIAERLKTIENERKELADRVAEQRKQVPTPQGRSIADRAEAAYELGLHGEALNILLNADYAAFGNKGLQLETELLLIAGRASDVLDWVTAGHRDHLGGVGYHWVRARAAAAIGDYSEFDVQMRELNDYLGSVAITENERSTLREPIARGVARAILNAGITPITGGEMILTPLSRIEALDQSGRFAGGLRQQAKGEVLRGIIAIEAGNIAQAETLLLASLKLWISAADAQSGAGLDFPGRRVAQDALEILRSGK